MQRRMCTTMQDVEIAMTGPTHSHGKNNAQHSPNHSITSDIVKSGAVEHRQCADAVEELIQEEEAATSVDIGDSEHSVWMVIDGKPCHKWTVIRTVLSMKDGFDRRKSTDRILRVRCYSIGGEKWEVNVDPATQIPKDDKFTFGDLFVTLLHQPAIGVCLAVIQTTAMRCRDISVPALSRKEMVLPKSSCMLSGEVLSLVPLVDADCQNDKISTDWLWDGNYIAFNPSQKKNAENPATLNQKALVITSPGFLATPVGDNADRVSANKLPSFTTRRKQGLAETWSMPHDFLKDSVRELWDSARCQKYLSKISTVGNVIKGNLP
ncbi:hypothetical protein MPER_01483 [Moniliophthora perniciosa FA553]|nr:hypothetical protein MPER_01483 [Moniliophthora perniciosa FA553]